MKTELIKKSISAILAGIMSVQAVAFEVFANDNTNSEALISANTESNLSVAEPFIIGEDVSKRTECTKTFDMSDGTYVVAYYDTAVHYKDANDVWQDIDNTLSTSSVNTYSLNSVSSSVFANTSNDVDVMFSQSSNADTMMNYSGDGFSLSWSLDGAADKSGQIIDNSLDNESEMSLDNISSEIVYEDVFENVDVKYEIYGRNVKESIIVNDNCDSYVYDYTVFVEGVTLSLSDSGDINAVDEDNNIKFTIPAPFMTDADGDVSYNVSYSLDTSNASQGVYSFSVIADSEWINDDETVFPVVIDPTIDYPVDPITTVGIDGNFPEQSMSTLKAGIGSTSTESMSLFAFDIRQMNEGDMVVKAELKVAQQHDGTSISDNTNAYTCIKKVENPWQEGFCWCDYISDDFTETRNAPAIDYNEFSVYDNEYTYIDITFDITKAVCDWYSGDNNYGLLLYMDGVSPGKSAIAYYGTSGDVAPTVTITYQNTKGLEDYWSYQLLNCGDYTSVYINEYNGNPVVVTADNATSGMLLPISLGHIYNGSSAGEGFSNMQYSVNHYGYGWKSNAQEGIGFRGNNIVVYQDADGTVHYLEKEESETVFKDMDGLGLELEYNSDNDVYIMTDAYGIEKTFDNLLLTSIKDSNGNQADIEYTSGNITKITDGAGKEITLTYTNSKVTSISDSDGNSVEYTYSSGLLTNVNYKKNDTTTYTINYTYNSSKRITQISTSDGKSVAFTYTSDSSGKVATVSDGTQTLVFEYSTDNSQTTYYLETTAAVTDKVIAVTDIFDRHGRVESQYSAYLDKSVVFGAADYTYILSDSEDDHHTANRIATAAANGRETVNLVSGGNLETTNSFTAEYSNITASESAVNVSTDAAYIGNKSLKVSINESVSPTESTAVGGYQSVLLAAGTYTLQAMVKVDGVSGDGGAFVSLRTSQGLLNASSNNNSRWIKSNLSDDINDGWQKLTTTITLDTATTVYVYLGLVDCVGDAYFDCIQLEKGNSPSAFNLISNSGFESAASDSAWSLSAGTRADEDSIEGYSMKITSTPSQAKCLVYQAYIGQEADENGNAVNPTGFSLSGWAKADSVPIKDNRTFRLKAEIYYNDSSKQTVYADFNDYCSDWQYASAAIIPEQTLAIECIVIFCEYYANCNSVYFDNLSLTQNEVTLYEYDDDGNITLSRSSSGATESYTYDEDGNMLTSTDSSGNTTTYTYDENGNVVSAVDGLGISTNYGYNSNGNVTSTIIAGNANSAIPTLFSKTVYTDDGNYILSSIDERGNATSYTYYTDENGDMNGQVKSITDPNGNTICYTYYDDGNVKDVFLDLNDNGTCDSGETVNTFEYDDTYTTIAHNSFEYEIKTDSSGNVTEINIGTINLIKYEYVYNLDLSDDLDRMDIIFNAGSVNVDTPEHVTRYIYDDFGQVVKVQEGNTTTLTDLYEWIYDSNSNIYHYINHETDTITEFEYDVNGNAVRATEYDSDNVNSNVLEVISAYDASSKCTWQSYKYGDDDAKVYSYTYDDYDRVQYVNLPNSAKLQNYYDALNRNRVDRIYNSDGTVIAQSRVVTYISGSNSGLGTSANQATTHLPMMYALYGASEGSSYVYAYDANGNITSITKDGTEQTKYTYDELNRLVREDNYDANKTYTYSYDAGGNITSVKEYAYTTGELGAVVDTISYGYNYSAWKDRLSSYDGQTISYGATGLPILYRNMVMVWENGRELGELLTADSKMVYYEYDANGLRTSKTIDGTKTEYVWLGDMLIREQTGTNVTYYLYDENGAAIGFEYNGTPYYYLKNIQGDVLSIVDNSGAIVVNYTYNAWGEIISTTGTLASTIGVVNKLRYRSYYYDSETGFYYLQSRYYDPVVKRFISPDSTDYLTANGAFGGFNLYAYCCNKPVNYTDVNGCSLKSIFRKAKNLVEAVLHAVNTVLVSKGIDTAAIGARYLDMTKDRYGIYHANFDSWQQYFGYNNLYDRVFDYCTSMKSKQFPFTCNGKKYILWAWKADYINLGAGAEIGIYYGGGPHWKVNKKLAMNMSLILKYKGKVIISYTKKTWWLTAFNPNYINVQADQLTAIYTVYFNSFSMYNAFRCAGWTYNRSRLSATYVF